MAGAWQSSVYAWNGGSYQIWELGAETATRRYLYATTTYTYATEQFRQWTVDDSALYFWFADSGGPYSRWQIRLFLPDSFTAYDNADWGWMTFTPVDP